MLTLCFLRYVYQMKTQHRLSLGGREFGYVLADFWVNHNLNYLPFNSESATQRFHT